MLVKVNHEQARALLGAMRTVATVAGKDRLTDISHRALSSASRVLFQAAISPESLPSIAPHELNHALTDSVQAMWAVRFWPLWRLSTAR